MARLLIFLCVCVFQIVFSQIVDEECETVVKSVGTCLNIKLCPPYVTLLENFGSRPDVQNFLRTTTCGSEGGTPKVCCPRQFLQPTTTNPLQPPTTKNPFQPATAPLPSGRELAKSIPTDATDLIPAFPSPPECGVSNATFGRVVGGEDAKLGDLPWMALLGYKVRPSLTSWLCGGSLISPRHVITAAHCIHKQENSLYVVRLGELDLASEEDGATPLDVLIKSMIQHERYDPLSFENDIGLLVLRTHVQYSELIKPICLPVDSALRAMDFVDWTPLVAGWGQLSARGAQATHLQVLQLPVLPNDVCVQTYSVYEEKVIDERIICAGYVTGGRDTCSGDSGGPLMQPMPMNFTSFYYQIGVISFGPLECARPGLPGIYTRITSFMPWLQAHVIGTP